MHPFLFRELYAFLFSLGAEKNSRLCCHKKKNGIEPSWLEMRMGHQLSESESLGNSCSRSPIKGTAGADDG